MFRLPQIWPLGIPSGWFCVLLKCPYHSLNAFLLLTAVRYFRLVLCFPYSRPGIGSFHWSSVCFKWRRHLESRSGGKKRRKAGLGIRCDYTSGVLLLPDLSAQSWGYTYMFPLCFYIFLYISIKSMSVV